MGKKRKHFNNGRNHRHDDGELTEDLQCELEQVFNKVFSYTKPSKSDSWVLPKPSEIFTSGRWEEPTLIDLKTTINEVKDKLSDVDVVPWHDHTQFTHKASKVMTQLRRTIGAELCTQAWCKFHEILGKFQLVPEENSDVFESVHICEAPGAFVTSLNHYLRSHYPNTRWHWTANTLNPFYEGNDPQIMIDDVMLIKDTLQNWYFGVDNTGDITKKANLLGLTELFRSRKVSLVTADGSINCQNNPAEQERLVAFLHFSEAVAALNLLKIGGHFVIKMFTLFEAESVCLLYLLNCLFDKVNIMKPATSKPGNSEVYVVGENFIGINQGVLLRLLEKCENESFQESSMFSLEHLPESFFHQHLAACKKFKAFQEETIESNFRCFQNMCPGDRHNMEFLKDQCARMYMDLYQVYSIGVHDRVVPNKIQGNKKVCTFGAVMNYQRKRLQGSYNERQKLRLLPWRDRVAKMKSYDLDDMNSWCWLEHQYPSPYLIEKLVSWKPVRGQRVDKVLCSRFCHQELLEEHTALLENALFLRCQSGGDVLYPSGELEPTCQQLIEALDCEDNVTWRGVGQETPFVLHLQKELEKASKAEGSENTNGKQVLLSDICSPDIAPEYGETKTTPLLLSCTVNALKIVEAGDSLVCRIYSALTRYVAGLVYILTHCFAQVAIDDFSQDGSSPSCILVCKDFISCPPELLEYLEGIDSQEDQLNVLQFVPADCFLDSVFRSAISNMNERVFMNRINTWLNKELAFIAEG
ncbi:cap-specific mRNA (nucleoside-2'-O-)-methyltransferase 2-like [Lineus longissimus]|uniref:cap-specific mRNA (nucleoside-2'-O-)-methyltransferase 2-like n=1 Tax=Lineus longissimus TaxID=88925 RepID=UPI00315D8C74